MPEASCCADILQLQAAEAPPSAAEEKAEAGKAEKEGEDKKGDETGEGKQGEEKRRQKKYFKVDDRLLLACRYFDRTGKCLHLGVETPQCLPDAEGYMAEPISDFRLLAPPSLGDTCWLCSRGDPQHSPCTCCGAACHMPG